MKLFERTFKLLVLITLLLALWLCLLSIGANAEIRHIPHGWVSPAAGYYMTEDAGRDILEGWASDRAARDTYKAALDDMSQEWQGFNASLVAQVEAVKVSLANERATNKATLRRARAPGFGVFAGCSFNGGAEFVVGAGLVWKIF